MAVDPQNVPAPVRGFVDAAKALQLDAMFGLVDWQVSRAAAWAKSLDNPALPDDRAPELIAEGFHELEHVERGLVESKLREIALHLAGGGELRAATSDEAAAIAAALRVPAVKRALPAEIDAGLARWRERAARVGEVWIAATPARKSYAMAVTGDGATIALVPR
jgi:hypothetical protein